MGLWMVWTNQEYLQSAANARLEEELGKLSSEEGLTEVVLEEWRRVHATVTDRSEYLPERRSKQVGASERGCARGLGVRQEGALGHPWPDAGLSFIRGDASSISWDGWRFRPATVCGCRGCNLDADRGMTRQHQSVNVTHFSTQFCRHFPHSWSACICEFV